jgi:hypothetical protein
VWAGQQGRAGAWSTVIFISFFKVAQVAILHGVIELLTSTNLDECR